MPVILKRIITDKTFLITLILAIFSMTFGAVKLSDIDANTITSLAALILLITIYQALNVLKFVANYIIAKCSTIRSVVLVLLLCSFFGSMFFTNDVAILTLVPIVFNIAQKINVPKILTISLLTIYANLGSALTPFGNPQNIYLVSHYHLGIGQFMMMSLPFGLVALLSMFVVLLVIKNQPIDDVTLPSIEINQHKTWLLLGATLIVLLGILSVIPVYMALIVSVVAAVCLQKSVFKYADYGIILTFVNFFIIVGAISRIKYVQTLLYQHTTSSLETFFSGMITSQFISNVPAAILISKFTQHSYGLYLGVTVGGLGTLIASLANLLALRQYAALSHYHSTFGFFKTFSLLNIGLLLFFIIVGFILLSV
ncbi:SLC13 family permease [Leuconostoc falkenbergense]|uniref:SLC13 family permease n=1 Tax=Leuconostoc falkenbergense TaxID=2766470 RepID=UPI0024AE635E|nr:SLC13 family permease [Leuconostoc falkenbergense]MDI6667975.1 SLC13 family permease [Leuconostoc falkenbergense]